MFKFSKLQVFVVVVLAIVAVGAVLWTLPAHLVNESAGGRSLDVNDRVDAIMQERRSILAALAALGAGLGLCFTQLRHPLDRDCNRTERYTAAIEQLGHDNIDVRLGGIYALDRIAVDSERDSETITEVLCAFIREHSQHTESEPPTGPEAPGTDVQAALTVLGRRQIRGWARILPADLTGANLAGANLNRAKFSGANLAGANLNRAKLSGANLTNANLFGADFTNANLFGADLNSAQLVGADLTDAYLVGADLSRAQLVGADLTNADLTNANLANACLVGTDLRGADLTHTNIVGADLTNVKGHESYIRPGNRLGGPRLAQPTNSAM